MIVHPPFADGRYGAHLPGCYATHDPLRWFFVPCTCSRVVPLWRVDFAAIERALARVP